MAPTIPANPTPENLSDPSPKSLGGDGQHENSTADPAFAWVDRYGAWFLAVFVFFIFFYNLGGYWLFDVDEPRYAQAAREMIQRGNLITPYFNDVIRLEKPVFFYWLLIASYKLFGVSEFSARLVSAVMASGLTAMTYAVARIIASKRFAFFSAVILLTSMEVIGLSRMSITDMTLATLMGGTSLSLFLACEKNPRWWLAAGLFSGMAILTKGPVGMVLPGGVFLLYTLITRQFKRGFLSLYFPLGTLLALVIAAPWYYLAYLENGQFFVDSLLANNISRFSGAIDYHSEPVYYYAIVLLAGFLPWSPFLVSGVRQSIVEWQHNRPWNNSLSAFQRLHWYAAIWAISIFTFFTIADTKLLTYILPMFSALALWLAAAFYNGTPDHNKQTGLHAGLKISAWVLFGLLSIVSVVFITQMGRLLPKEAAHISANPANWIASLVLLLGVLGFSLLLQKNRTASAFILMGATFSLLAVIALTGIVPRVNQLTQGQLMTYINIVGDNPLGTYEITKPSLTFYANRHIPQIQHDDNAPENERDKLKAFLQQGCSLNIKKRKQSPCQPVYLITKHRFIAPLKKNLPDGTLLRFVSRDDIFSLLSLQQK
ncbi:MAG: glycosyltransferase family 39 protein [Vampirovibrionales bacterium]|nr:glycosyltransferase family 39 protein [Vampirovibrionales bacterium]